MNSKMLKLTVAGVLISGAAAAAARAQSGDAIIDKLVEKGVLTVDEGNELKDEADKGFNSAFAVKTGLPEWVNALKISGDFRGRYEGFYSDAPGFTDFTRFRYRARIGFVANIKDNFEVGIRFGSGNLDSYPTNGIDPISQNQTLQNNASKKGVFIDLAYGKWYALNTPELSAALTIGKMENPFILSDMLFDGDYTPEGAAEQFIYTLTDKQSLKFNFGQFVVDENNNVNRSVADPALYGFQTLLDSTWTPKVSTSLGVSYLTVQNTQNLPSSAVPDINKGNLRYVIPAADGKTAVMGAPVYGFSTIVGDASATYMLSSAPLYSGPFPVKVLGEYLYNFDASDSMNYGWQAGLTLGKAGKKGTWELSYRYKWLGGDAWWEELVDSDFGAYYLKGTEAPPFPAEARSNNRGYQSGTNVKGNVVKLQYSVTDALTLSTTWFNTRLIDAQPLGSASQMNRIQVDALLKF